MNKHLDHFKDAIKKDDLQQQYKRHVEDQQKRLVDITRKPTHLINYGDVCAEVGVWKGKYSWEILSRGPSKLHLIGFIRITQLTTQKKPVGIAADKRRWISFITMWCNNLMIILT